MNGLIEKASVLIEALPYIRTFFGKTFVIKYGGHAMKDPELKKAVILDVILLKYVGLNPILVHGGGPEINQLAERLGKESAFVQGHRVTDEEMMEIVQMVLVGKVNQEIVSLINKYGGKSIGLSGKDGNLIVAKRRVGHVAQENGGEPEPIDLGYVGDVESINPEPLHLLSNEGFIPVVSSVGVGLDGESLNINADAVAGHLAVALKAEKLIVLTDVEGISGDSDGGELISSLRREEATHLIAEEVITGGMIPKVEACLHALEAGVSRTHIIDGRMMHSILLEIFTDKGIGTMVVQ